MKHNTTLVRYSEIGTKGLNRSFFENKLIHNIKDCLIKNKIKDFKIKKESGRILIFSDKKCSNLKNVFGIASFSYALELHFKDINKTALSLIKKQKTFRISARRLDKNFPITSQKLNEEIGAYIIKNKNIKVSLKKPDINIGIEIINKRIYIFIEKIRGYLGLPVTTEGSSYLHIKNLKRAIVAGFLILKRGSSLTLSKNLPLLKKFEYGFKIKTRKENKNDRNIITDEINLKNIKKKENKLILNPLIGLTTKQMNDIYKKISH